MKIVKFLLIFACVYNLSFQSSIADDAKIVNNPTTVGAENYEAKIPIKCGDGTTYKILTTKHPQR